jgi:hypothetical protein
MAAAAWSGCSGSDVTARGQMALRSLVCACALLGAGPPAVAQDSLGTGQFGSAGQVDGQVIARVEVEIGTPSGDPARDAKALRSARAAIKRLLGRGYRPLLVETATRALVEAGGVMAATHRTSIDGARGDLGVIVTLDMAPAAGPATAKAVTAPGFPVIYQDDRSKLTFLLTGGGGVYSDSNPWFGVPGVFTAGSPVAGELPGSQTTWVEGYLEFGIAGATQIADSDFYLFGAASATFTLSRGQDIFTADKRNRLHPDRGYVGLLYADKESGNTAQLSFGRQTWSLNNGFLISSFAGSSNAGERGASYLGPRNTTDFTALATGEFGKARYALFYIDPDELEDLESNTTFAGANLGYQFSDAFTADISLITIPASDSAYRTPGGDALPRRGTRTYGGRVLYRGTTPDHFWFEGEAYAQSNSRYDLDAKAYYGTIGYIWDSHPWKPSVSYRYASFSGDDPDTASFERFDSLMSTGFGNWLQGISFGKVYRNANLNTHRIQVNVAPRPGLNVTFEWHQLRADQLNNLGGNPALSLLSSRDIGNEYTLAVRWGIDRNRYLQLVASHARPGRALRAVGADEPWTTLQAGLYVNF